MKKLSLITLLILIGFSVFAQQVGNKPTKSQVSLNEGFFKLEYHKLGSCSMHFYSTNRIDFYLRTKTNFTTKTRTYELFLDYGDNTSILERVDWDIVLKYLTILKEEHHKDEKDVEFRFSTKSGITFFTRRDDKVRWIHVDFPNYDYDHSFSSENIDVWISVIKEAKEKAK